MKRNIKFDFENGDKLLKYYSYITYNLFCKKLKERHYGEYKWRRWYLRDIIEKKSIIKMELQIEQNDVNKEIYFLNNAQNNTNEDLKKLNDSNVKLYINDKKYNFQKYFIPTEAGIYSIFLEFKTNIKDCSYLFSGCENITKINLKYFRTEEVHNMAHLFDGCKNLENLDLYRIKTKNVTNMSNMFRNCGKLRELNLKFFETKNVTDMSGMFEGCTDLSEIGGFYFDTKNVTDMSNMFRNCQN